MLEAQKFGLELTTVVTEIVNNTDKDVEWALTDEDSPGMQMMVDEIQRVAKILAEEPRVAFDADRIHEVAGGLTLLSGIFDELEK